MPSLPTITLLPPSPTAAVAAALAHTPEKVGLSQLNVIRLDEFLKLRLPEREFIMSPWLMTSGLCQIHAYRGIGKTHVSLGIAYAVATGAEFLNWKAPKARSVLFIDGEMPGSALQERFNKIAAMHNNSIPANLQIITPDLQHSGGVPDLATYEGQEIVNQHITNEIELIILDNLSCLVRSGKENNSEDWLPVQSWLLSLRAKRKSVLIIHHSGKSGAQRGCSKREDLLDSVLALERPKDYQPSQGARFIVKYEKARGFFGTDAKPFEAQLIVEGDKQHWVTRPLEESTHEKIITMFNDGMSQNDIADELGLNKSTIWRHINSAKEEGKVSQQKENDK